MIYFRMADQLKKEIANLQRRLSSMSTAGPSKKRKSKSKTPNVVAPLVQRPIRTGSSTKSKRGIGPADGSCRVRRKECLFELHGVGGINSWNFLLRPSDFPWLKKIAGAFSRVTWHSCKVSWRSAVGTQRDGLISYGADWDTNIGDAITRATVLSLTPVMDHPVWQTTDTTPMVLPASKLMTRKEYLFQTKDLVDSAPASIMAWCTGSEAKVSYGEIWIEYDLTLFGTV